MGSVEEQKSLIREIKDTKLVIYRGQTDHWGYLPTQKKLPLVNNYINSNFPEVVKILKWEVKFK